MDPVSITNMVLTYTVIASSAYVAMLTFFRTSVLENDSYLQSFLEVLFSGSMGALVWYSDLLVPVVVKMSVRVMVAVVALYFAYKMHQCYVSGSRYQRVNLDGKVYIITGSNTGLGYETALRIVSMGGTVVLACRSMDRAKEAKEKILSFTKCAPTKVYVLKLDLCGFDSVRKFMKEFRALKVPLHGLINNAGVMMSDRCLTQDGFEMVFTANHLSHFLLTNLLLPELEKNEGRIVNVTSCLHKSAKRFDFDDVMSERNYSLFGTYAQSKLANILFTVGLQKRYVTQYLFILTDGLTDIISWSLSLLRHFLFCFYLLPLLLFYSLPRLIPSFSHRYVSPLMLFPFFFSRHTYECLVDNAGC